MSANAAAKAAEAVAYAVLGISMNWSKSVTPNYFEKSISAAIQVKRYANSMSWFATYEAAKAAEDKGEMLYLKELEKELNKFHEAVKLRGLTEKSGVPWHLFCSQDPTLNNSSIINIEPMRPKYASVFISYSHSDAEFVSHLFSELKKCEVDCWLDEHSMKPGERILDSIAIAIGGSEKIILCCSENSLNSWWVKDEIRKALERERTEKKNIIIPLLLDDYLLKKWNDGLAVEIRSRLAADFIGVNKDRVKFDKGFKKILDAIHLKI